MHKTMLAALIVGASTLSIPAFAQVNLGAAAQVGAGVNTGAVVPNTMHSVDQTGAQTTQRLHRADRNAKRMTHRAADHTRSAMDHSGNADASLRTGSSIDAGRSNTHASATTGARVDAHMHPGAAANQTGQTGQRMGDQASDAAHSTIQATDRTAGSVGDAVNQTTTGQSVGADAKVDASAAAHGH